MPSRKISAAAQEQSPAGQRILRAAFRAFTKNGYAQTSTLEIATAAQVSKRELYRLFGGKQAMMVACIESRASRLRMSADFPPPADRAMLEGQLRRFGENMLREVCHPTVLAMLRLAVAEAERSPEIARTVDRMGMRANRSALAELLHKAQAAGQIGPGEATGMVLQFLGLIWENLMFELLLRTASSPGADDIAARAERAARAFLALHPAPGPRGRT
jgi:AcrR family transcriptional regulator